MAAMTVRDFSKRGDAIPVHDLDDIQRAAYERFLQLEREFDSTPTVAGATVGVKSKSAISQIAWNHTSSAGDEGRSTCPHCLNYF